jgi:hypothetical protein
MSLRYLVCSVPGTVLTGCSAISARKNLRSPVGLNLGANNPEEVALAIVSEITTALHGRSDRSLSARDGPIHPAEDHIGRATAHADPVDSNSVNEVAVCAVVGS